MANELAVKLVISGDTGNLQANLQRIQDQLRQINGGSGGGVSIFSQGAKDAETFQQSLRGLIGRFSALWAVMKSGEGIAGVFNVGVKYNATLQDATLGIGALITAQAKLSDSNGKELTGRQALTAAMAMGTNQIQQLRIAGLQTAATTEQLVGAYQDAVGGGLRANMTLDQIRRLTVQTVQAAGAMGVPMNQLNQEIRSILDGTIDRNSRVAIRLGITNADVERWRSAGTLFTELNQRMAAFSEAGKESMKNWTTLLSNINEASQILMGEAFRSPMKGIQAELQRVMDFIVNSDTAQLSERIQPVLTMLKDLGDILGDFAVGTIKAITSALQGMGDWWVANREAINGVIASFKIFMSDTLAFIGGTAATLIRWVADAFLWFSKLPEPIKAINVAILAMSAAMMLANTSFAGTIATSVGTLIGGLQKLGMVFAVATTGATGFSAAMTALGGPVAWAIGAIAALGAGVYYMATSEERAGSAALALKKQTTEKTEALVNLLPALKAVDSAMKEAATDDADAAQKRKAFKQSVEDLIRTYPEQARFIREQIADGQTLAQVWLMVAKNKLAALSADLASAKLADERRAAAVSNSTNSGGSKPRAGGVKFKTQMEDLTPDQVSSAVPQSALDSHSQLINLMQTEVDNLSEQIRLAEKEVTIKTSSALTEKQKAEAEKRRVALEQLSIVIQNANLDAMPRLTAEQKEAYEIEKSNLELSRERVRIEKLLIAAHADENTKKRVLKAVDDAADREKLAVHAKFLSQKEEAEKKYYDFIERQEGDTLARKKVAIAQELDARAKAAGIVLTQEERTRILAERFNRETVAFQESKMKQLEAALKDLEKQKQTTFSFEEQKAAIIQLAEKLLITSDIAQMLIDKLQGKNDVRQGGILDGFKAAADEIINKFKSLRDTVKDALVDMARTAEQSTSQLFVSMFEHGMTGAQKWDQVWRMISKSVLKGIGDIIAAELRLWAIEKIRAAWKAISTKMEITDNAVKASSQVATTATVVAANTTEATSSAVATTANTGKAVSGYFASYASIPWVGIALAVASIAVMMAMMKQYTGRAVGGRVNKPEYTLLGEAGPEIVAPESTFLDWIRDVGNPAVRAPRNGFSRNGNGEPAYEGMTGGTRYTVQASFDGAMIIGDSADGLRKAATALRTIRVYDERMNG